MKKITLILTLLFTLLATLLLTGFNYLNEDSVTQKTYSAPLRVTYSAAAFTGAEEDDDDYVISFLGDSITYGYKSEESYTEYLSALLDADESYNYGICSTEISDSGNNWKQAQSFVYRYDEIDEDSDLIFVLGGTNDFSHCATLGEMGDTGADTFYGALDTLYSSLLEEYPDATIVVATPLRRCDTGWEGFTLTNEDGEYEYVNSNGDSLEDFANAIKEVADKYGITVIDLYNAEEVDFTSDTDYTTYWEDGLHPNAFGDSIIANYLYTQFEELGLVA